MASPCCQTGNTNQKTTRRVALPGCSYVYEPLPFVRRAAYSVGHVMNDLCAATWFSYLLPYLTKAVNLKNSQAGIVMFSGQIADAMATPAVGLLSDRSQGCPQYGCGRRLLWNFMGVCLVTLCYLMVFAFCIPCWVNGEPIGSEKWWFLRDKTINYAIAASFFNFGWASVQVSHMALVPELSIDESERVLLNSARYGFTIFSNSTVFISLLLLLLANGEAMACSDDAQHPSVYHHLAYIVIGIGGACSLFFLMATKEPTSEELKERSKFARKLMKIQDVKKSKDLEPVEDFKAYERDDSGIKGARKPVHGGHQFTDAVKEFGRATSDCRSGSIDVYDAQYPKVNSIDEFDELTNHAYSGSSEDNEKHELLATLPEESDSPVQNNRESNASEVSHHVPKKWSDWFKVPEFYTVGLNYMCTRLVVNVSQVYIQFYIQNTLKMPSIATAIVPLVVYLASFVGTLLVKPMNRRFGRRISYFIGSGLVTVACIIMVFLTQEFSGITYGAAFLLGLGNATLMVTTVSLEADLVGSDTESGAFVYGSMSFTDKLSNGIVVLAVQFAHSGTDGHAQFYRYIVTVIPIVAAIVGALSTMLINIRTTSAEDAGDGVAIDELLEDECFDGNYSNREKSNDKHKEDPARSLLLNAH